MGPIEALELVEDPEADAADVLDAWRELIRSGIVWSLPGRYGRQAAALLESGALE
jgi:hypothetical protein